MRKVALVFGFVFACHSNEPKITFDVVQNDASKCWTAYAEDASRAVRCVDWVYHCYYSCPDYLECIAAE